MNDGRSLDDVPVGVLTDLPESFRVIEEIGIRLGHTIRDDQVVSTAALELLSRPHKDPDGPAERTTYLLTQEQLAVTMHGVNLMWVNAYGELAARHLGEHPPPE